MSRIVADCTDSWTDPKPPFWERKEVYLAHLPGKPQRSLLVSLADKTHNATAILFDLRRIGEDAWPRFNGGKEGTLWYYGAVSEIFDREMPGMLSDQLRETVAALRNSNLHR